jgi:D-glycero-alpha-D-manno-heptose 1-phosphate guanylyltransferase
METIILAGGKGTRLSSVVNDRPKPLADVNGRPFLEHLMDHLTLQGCNHFVLSTGFKKDMIKSHFGSNYRDVPISYVEEDEPLGTGGATLKAHASLKGNNPFLIVNGDTYFNIDLARLTKFFVDTKSDLSIALFKAQESGRYGKVILESDSSIRAGFQKKADIGEPANGGFFMVRHTIFEGYTPSDSAFSFEADLLPAITKNGAKITGCAFDSTFFDIGVPDDYFMFCEQLRAQSN